MPLRKFVVVFQSLSCVLLFAILWTAACQTSLSFTVSQSLLKFMSTELVMPSKHLILSPASPPAFNLSQHQGLFQWVSSSHWVAKVLELQLHHQSIQWILRVDSFGINWFDLPAGQRTLRSLLQHHNSKASIEHQCSTFSHTHTWLLEKPKLWLYGPLSAMMSLLFNTLSRSA